MENELKEKPKATKNVSDKTLLISKREFEKNVEILCKKYWCGGETDIRETYLYTGIMKILEKAVKNG